MRLRSDHHRRTRRRYPLRLSPPLAVALAYTLWAVGAVGVAVWLLVTR